MSTKFVPGTLVRYPEYGIFELVFAFKRSTAHDRQRYGAIHLSRAGTNVSRVVLGTAMPVSDFPADTISHESMSKNRREREA